MSSKPRHVEAGEEEAEHFLDRLIEIGFLRLRSGIPEQEVDWDLPLRAVLEPVDDESASRATVFLGALREKTDRFLHAGIDARRDLLDSASDLVRSGIGRTVGIKADLPFYEDAAGEAELVLPENELSELGAELADYVELTSRLAWMRGEQATLRAFFDQHYGVQQSSTPLLRFYEDYYREHFKEHLERLRQARIGVRRPQEEELPEGREELAEEEARGSYDLANPFGVELIETIREVRGRLSDMLRQRWRRDPEAEEIILKRGDLVSVLERVPRADTLCRSVSMFVNYLPRCGRDRRPALVANGYLPGYGKYFSRFLYLLPGSVERTLVERNDRLTEEYLAEIGGDGAFNGNLHPPLMRWEISYPTGESGAGEPLLCTDLDVERDPGDVHALCLRHRATGRRVIPVDLGFLNPRMRPPLHQLLSRFSTSSAFQLPVPGSPHTGKPTEAGSPPEDLSQAVLYRPRITYRGRLVLARRTWLVPAAAFPWRTSGETAASYFLRVWRWRREHGIPEQVFSRVFARPVPDRIEENEGAQSDETDQGQGSRRTETKRTVRSHLYKPQYIDFGNPHRSKHPRPGSVPRPRAAVPGSSAACQSKATSSPVRSERGTFSSAISGGKPALRREPAMDELAPTGRGVRIGVIDSGCDRQWHEPRIRPGVGLVDPRREFEARASDDDHDRIGHGTACADIILRHAPGAEIFPIRVFHTRLESSPGLVIAALEWAIEHRMHVVNLSLGALTRSSLRPIYRACEVARRRGAILVSAVNNHTGWSYPAVFENTIGVEAGLFPGQLDFVYRDSEAVECIAHGGSVVRWLRGERRPLFGSSFAAPRMSAIVAHLLELCPGASLEKVRQLLDGCGHGDRPVTPRSTEMTDPQTRPGEARRRSASTRIYV